MTTEPESKAEAAASYREGLARFGAGDTKGAFGAFLMALALDPTVHEHRRMALHYLGITSGYTTLPPPVLAALAHCSADKTLDLQPLALVVRTLFEADPRLPALETLLDSGDGDALEQALRTGDCGWIVENPLISAVLSRALNISLRLENVLTALRRHALRAAEDANSTVLVRRFDAFFAALAAQATTNRGLWMQSEDERAKVAALAKNNRPDAVLIRAAYQGVDTLPVEATAHLPKFLKDAWYARQHEEELARDMPQFTPVAAGVSRAVEKQYATFPYPPWDRVSSAGAPMTLGENMRAQFPYTAFDAAFKGPVEILSAGCGTGYGALLLALTISKAKITAVDLSRPSLAFAQRKAEEHGAANIMFGVADILNIPASLPPWHGRFHLIECTGVLHHMADPAAGLAALTQLLRPGGVMKLAFYSARGRQSVIAARELVQAGQYPDTREGVRAARAAIMELPEGHAARGVMNSPEFFTVDGLHDLIFNVHEMRYHPREVKRLLAAAGLKVLGVETANPVRAAGFAARHPGQNADLDAWDAFEEAHPDTFAEMIQTWCVREAT